MPELPLALVWWLVLLSVVTLAVSAVGLPWVLTKLPADYFLSDPGERRAHSSHATGRRWLALGRNALGILLMLAGVALLVLPGQGILTILAGLLLTDVPGKRRIELMILRQAPIRRAVEALRHRRGLPPLHLPSD